MKLMPIRSFARLFPLMTFDVPANVIAPVGWSIA